MAAPRIFIVEDNPTIRDSLIPTLEDLTDAEIVGMAEGEDEAVRWMQAHSDAWDLAIVDLFLRQGSGLGVLRRLRNGGARQRMVVLTNYATADMRRRCSDAGADRVFDKSNDLDAFFDYCNASPMR
ncbi:response regulator [Pseudacidovorax sp. RU35E]|jgi:DNA-binding NarL/FixJ family response regulator|uniref:response regulator n=1 Tax=Pseudacidovorax sp. RU35E TaxID=1907403 RepID=UPI00095561B9|nr:response regulator [Pseudacidovorax sp. RU35E]SIQ70277.1 Response regulator receiver domain-containing protein [Pseudacidovorax sp. RU35E]